MNSEHEDEHWALELLRHNEWEPSLLKKYGIPVVCGTGGFFSGVIINVCRNKPRFYGLQNHIIMAVVGVSLSFVVKRVTDDILGRREAIMIDYIKRHPERFPAPEYKKYADKFTKWRPKR